MSYGEARTELESNGFKIHNLDAADNLNCQSNAAVRDSGVLRTAQGPARLGHHRLHQFRRAGLLAAPAPQAEAEADLGTWCRR